MKSKFGNKDKLSGTKNDIQPSQQGRSTNWNAWNFKVDNGTEKPTPEERFDWDTITKEEEKKKK